MLDYLKNEVWDFLLVAICSMALNYIGLNGFYADASLQHSPLPAAVAIICVAALFVVARDKRTIRLGGAIYAVALVVCWIAAAALSPGGEIFVDNESNYLIFMMVTTIVPTICFLVSRKRIGVALLFIGGVLVSAVIQLLYQRFEVAWVVLFVVSVLALLMLKNYQLSLRTASSVRTASMLPGFGVALAAALIAVGLGAGIWYGIIAPLDPSAADIKLITEYRALETKQVLGTSNVFQTPNLDITSSQTNSDSRTTDDIKESVNGIPYPATGEEQEPDDQNEENTFIGIDVDSLKDTFDFQQNPSVLPLMLGIILAVILLIAAYFVGRRILRKKRLERLQALGPAEEFRALFLLMLNKFKRIGINVPNGQTILEFGESSTAAMEPYGREANVEFSSLASDYCLATYGNQAPTQDSISGLERLYTNFWKVCRHELGALKYFFKSFRL